MSFEHPVPKHLLTPIGDMTVSFAALELHMQAVLIFLVDQTARIGHILASQLSFTRLRAAILEPRSAVSRAVSRLSRVRLA